MKTAFSILFVCAFVSNVAAFTPQEFVDQYEYSTDSTPIVETETVIPAIGCRCSANRGITLRDMWDREHPDGTQHGHIPYQSNGMYYYRRPYNASHYRQHRMRLQQAMNDSEAIEPRFNDGFQYVDPKENHLFRSQIRSADPKRDRVDEPTDSGVLEFADWRRHEAANVAWAEKKSLEPQQQGTTARLSSHSK